MYRWRLSLGHDLKATPIFPPIRQYTETHPASDGAATLLVWETSFFIAVDLGAAW